ncbi:MAG: hypothetical protein ASARMPRED_008435 [Alectoria sarmentosa]|nr:MAG: hypothetical protein ASARMPRED_008435 [Alectoria sarmentosa]
MSKQEHLHILNAGVLDRDRASANRHESSSLVIAALRNIDAYPGGSASSAMEKGNKVLIIGAGCTGLALAHGLNKVCTGCYESRRDMYFQVSDVLMGNLNLSLTVDKRAGVSHVVYESRSNFAPLKRVWNFGLHWSAPVQQSLIPSELGQGYKAPRWIPTHPHIHKGPRHTSFPQWEDRPTHQWNQNRTDPPPGRTKLQALLSEGLDVDWEKKIVDIVYLGKRKGVKAVFEDSTEVTGSMLVGADGGRSLIGSLLVGPGIAKPSPIDFASTIWFTKYSRDRALFLRSAPHHPLFQIAPHPDGYYSWLGLHDALDPNHLERWVFWHYISFPEPREFENKKTVAE